MNKSIDINRKFRDFDKVDNVKTSKPADVIAEQTRIKRENRKYYKQLQEILKDRKKLVVGQGLLLMGDKFGKLKVDKLALKSERLRAYKGGNLVMNTIADPSLYELMTKRFVEGKKYTPQAVNTFRELVRLSELPIYDRRHNKKAKLLHNASDVVYYHDPSQLVERFGLLDASRRAGNTGVDNEISVILDELVNRHVITKEVAAKLY